MSSSHDDSGQLSDTSNGDKELSSGDQAKVDDALRALTSLATISLAAIKARANDSALLDATWDDERGTRGQETEYRPSELMLPGFGLEREDCGDTIPHICEDCGDVTPAGRTCRQSMCPRCAPKWVAERAVPIVSRLFSAAKMREGSQKFHHLAISPPVDEFVDADKPEQEMLEAIRDWLHDWGLEGVVLYHPYAGDHGEEIEAAHTGDIGKWKHRLFEGRDWHGDVREELQHRPHFHAIVVGEHVPGGDVTKAIYDRTGWVCHRITPRGSTKSIDDNITALSRAVTYALSHVGIDTASERNKYVRKKFGSAYHAADDRHHGKARAAINDVIGETLGVGRTDVECLTERPVADAGGADPDLADGATGADAGDGAGDDVDDLEPTADTATKMVPCKGKLTGVHKAEFVKDEDWQQRAKYAEDALATRRAYENGDLENCPVATADGPPPG